MKTMTFYQWAEGRGACDAGLLYLKGKPLSWATWIGSCGSWRRWVCIWLGVSWSYYDIATTRPDLDGNMCSCYVCTGDNPRRAELNEPARYAAIRRHWRVIVLPALRKAGVR